MNRMGSDNNSRIIHNNNDDDDDNGKNSKIQRDSRAFLNKALLIMGVLTVFALGLGMMHQEPTSPARSQHSVVNNNNMNNEVSHRESNNNNNSNNKDTTKVIQALDNSGGKSFGDIDTELAATVNSLDGQVRARKKTPDVIMETDEEGLKLTTALQQATLKLLEHRYGANTRHTKFRIVVDVLYPASVIKDPDSESHKGQFTIEMAPHDLIPCSVFYFMEMVRTFKSMGFHRNAGHVLQASSQSGATAGHKSMPFQEYSPLHPHAKYSTGYAGRPSGPEWYVSIQDNTNNHGPGSQQKKNPYEADSNFGNIVEGVESGVFAKIHSVPADGFLPKEQCTKMYKMTIMVNSINDPNQWTEWKPLSVIKD